MKKHLAVCMALIIVLSQLLGFCVSADTMGASAEAQSDLIVKAKGGFYTVVSGAKATKFGISPNSKGTEYYINPKQTDSEITFGKPSSQYNKSSFSILDVDVTDNTNFNVARKFTVTDAEGFNDITNTSLNLYQGDATAMQEWIEVPYADMRFFVKTSCEFTVTLSIACSYNGVYPHIKSRITVPAGSDWQEIRITRDDFSDNEQFEEFAKANVGTFYFRMMVDDNMLPENETVYISQPMFNNGAIDPSVVENVYTDHSYYYNNFQSYNTLEVTDSAYYSGTYNYNKEFRLSLPSVYDLSGVSNEGSLRFWVSVPKDITMYFGVASQNSSGAYGRAFCERALKASDNDAGGFQEVEIPLSELSKKEGSFSWSDIKFFAIRGINNCTQESFLSVGDTLKISPIEIWSGLSPEAKAPYTYIPKYYSVTGKVTVVDLSAAMDSRTQINAFAHSSLSDEYLQLARSQEGGARLLDVYSVSAVIAGATEAEASYGEYTEYAVTEAHTDMNVLLPVSEEMPDSDLIVGVVGENGFSIKTHEITDEHLIVNTNELGDFLIMSIDTPVYTASAVGTTVYDNTVIASGIEVVRKEETAEYQPIMSFLSSSAGAPSADTVNTWMADEDAQMSIWVKAPYKSEGTVNAQIDLCLRNDSSYLHRYAPVTLLADGYWHELRINASDFTGNSFASVTEKNYLNFYIRIKGNALGDEYWIGSDISFYSSPIIRDVNDGNIPLEKVAAVDTADTNKGNSTNVSVTKNANVYDNKFYDTAMVYSVTDASNYKFNPDNVTPYKIAAPDGNEFREAISNGGDARTYVKNVSDHDMTFTVGIKTWCTDSVNGKSGNFLLNQNVTVPSDGKWHEVRLSFKNLADDYRLYALKGVEGYTYGTVYMRIFNLDKAFTSTDDKLYITPLEIYNRSIIGKSDDDINDANIALERSAIVDTKDGGGASNISVSSVKIADNKFYRTAMKYHDPIVGSSSFSGNNTYPYKLAAVKGTEFKDFIKHHGVWRTYIKNASDHTMTFTVGLKIRYVTTTTSYKELKKTVEIAGDGKWHEIRISYDELGLNTASNEYKALAGTEGYTLNGVWMHITGLGKDDFTAATDELYITPLEIYNRDIPDAEATDFAREYKQAMLVTKYRTDKTDTYISKASASAGGASPFFSNAVTYTAKDGYSVGYESGQIGFVEAAGIDAESFADWYYNNDADLRIWVKAEKGTKFKLGVYSNGEIRTVNPISVKASPDWQLVTVSRSAFNDSTQMETNLSTATALNVNIFFFSVDGTFTAAGESISIGQCVEVYTDKAYEKGDVNRDNKVNIIDLIHIKKRAAADCSNVKNCDINNSGTIESADLRLMCKKLIDGTWS